MNKLSIVLPLYIILAVACDSNQTTEKSTAEKLASEKIIAEETLSPVETTDVATKKDITSVVGAKVETAVVDAEAKSELKVSMSGEQVYKKSCQSCHASGAAGAPKLGDAAAWKDRINKGADVLYLSALKGVPGTAMMAKGTCGTCSDEELNAAVDYMVSKVK